MSPWLALGWIGAGGLLLALIGAMTMLWSWLTDHGRHDAAHLPYLLTTIYAAAGMVLLLWLTQARHTPSRPWLVLWIGCAGLAMRLVPLTQPPLYEDDYYRYLWDGAVTAHGFNPYAFTPAAALAAGDPSSSKVPSTLIRLAHEQHAIVEHINHPHLATIYPPLAQGVFAAAYRLSPWNPRVLRLLFLTLDVLVLLLLLSLLRSLGRPAHWVAIYWWNPIGIKEFYIGAHMDVLVIVLVLLAIAAAVRQRGRLSLVALALAVGSKLWPVILLPVLLPTTRERRWRKAVGLGLFTAISVLVLWPLASRGLQPQSGLHAYAQGWAYNAGLYTLLEWVSSPATARAIVLTLLAGWVITVSRRPVDNPRELVHRCLWLTAGVFLLSPTQFPWYFTWLLPLLALEPVPALLLYTALLPLYHVAYASHWVLWAEHLPVWMLLMWWVVRRPERQSLPPHEPSVPGLDLQPLRGRTRVAVVIPAINEEPAIGHVLAAIPRWVHQVVVADNGSVDHTAAVAAQAGATVVREPHRGYGAACLAGIAALDQPDIVVFLDGDFSDHPQEMGRLIEPILRDEADLVIGSRVLGQAECGALTPQQRVGNALACCLMRLLYGVRYTDLGPFRAIRYSSLRRLAMDDRDYGWTVQMQVRAVRLGLRAAEIPVSYRCRIGKSKISGTLRGVIGAGTKIISTVLREGLRPDPNRRSSATDRIVVFARYPESGRAKTRLIPLLGPTGAALLHRQLVRMTLATARRLQRRRIVLTEVRHTGAASRAMATLFGTGVEYVDQGAGDLGQRLRRAAADALKHGSQRIVLIGTDCPLLSAGRLDEAFCALDNHDVVIGPATDGGYYLMGVKSDHPALFTGIAWGGPAVLAQTLGICRRLGLRYTLLPALPDVDTPEDLATWAAARLAPADATPRVSVIIPARNEQDHLAATIGSVLAAEGAQIIVADGQSTDRTAAIARAFGATLVCSTPSRGIQLNAGAALARSDMLLFLHADTTLPPDYSAVVQKILGWSGISAGAFSLGIDALGIFPRLVEWGVWLRSRYLGRPYGDQALFMRSQTYRACDGFPILPFMEDYAMLPRLKTRGRIQVVRQRVWTSARRWEQQGWLRTLLLHQWMVLRYHLDAALRPPDKSMIEENRSELDIEPLSNHRRSTLGYAQARSRDG